jgi:hypothetical protein
MVLILTTMTVIVVVVIIIMMMVRRRMTTTLIHHVLFNHQPGHLRRGTLHARQGERGSVGGEHYPTAAQSEVRLLVRHDPQCERLRIMVRTIKHDHPLIMDYVMVKCHHCIVSYRIICIVHTLIRSRVQMHYDSFIHPFIQQGL